MVSSTRGPVTGIAAPRREGGATLPAVEGEQGVFMRNLKLRLAVAAGLVLLAATAVVPQASATPPPWAHGHGGNGGGAPSANSIGLIAPWGPAALTAPDTITLSYSVSASKNVA